MSLTFTVSLGLALWLAANALSALRIPPFSTRLAAFRLFIPWRMFAFPVNHFHTLEYLDVGGSQPTWIVAASTRFRLWVPFLMSPTDLMADHLYNVARYLETAERVPARVTLTAAASAIERNLERHPAVRDLSASQAPSLRIVRRHPHAMAAADLVVREWTRSSGD